MWLSNMTSHEIQGHLVTLVLPTYPIYGKPSHHVETVKKWGIVQGDPKDTYQGFHGSEVKGHSFMQDEARPHCTEAIFWILNEHSKKKVIPLEYLVHCGSVIHWAANLHSLNPSDFFYGDTTAWYQILGWGCEKSSKWRFSTLSTLSY
jgi:hypothetical protein